MSGPTSDRFQGTRLFPVTRPVLSGSSSWAHEAFLADLHLQQQGRRRAMLNLNNLRNLLSQVLAQPSLHTAVLFTPQGQLVSYAADAYTPKDDIRVLVGLGGEVWQETKTQGVGMVDSELGHILVLPVGLKDRNNPEDKDNKPLMLVALNAEDSVSWPELESKGRELVHHLESPIAGLRTRLAASPVLLVNPRPERTGR